MDFKYLRQHKLLLWHVNSWLWIQIIYISNWNVSKRYNCIHHKCLEQMKPRTTCKYETLHLQCYAKGATGGNKRWRNGIPADGRNQLQDIFRPVELCRCTVLQYKTSRVGSTFPVSWTDDAVNAYIIDKMNRKKVLNAICFRCQRSDTFTTLHVFISEKVSIVSCWCYKNTRHFTD